eukprot:m.92454 g.92454  ORF g.92454 m.92454 type:complete len:282 (-) comp13351_c0_seq1:82-927(-)
MSKRPEHAAPADMFYDDTEARKYTENTRMMQIQSELTQRCLELLNLPQQPAYLLDIGCGSGLSGEELTDQGHMWVGIDISRSMLEVAKEREVDGDLFLHDMGQGVFFKPGTFDGVISVSALQWLCNADKAGHVPHRRMKTFFTSLYACMAQGSRAVFQFYPETPEQMQLVTSQAMKAGFSGGIVIDYPNSTRAKKTFLCLFTGGVPSQLPQGKSEGDGQNNSASFIATDRRSRGKKGGPRKGTRDWILQKKERRRRQLGPRQRGEVRPDTKFTGRKRKPRF